MARTYEQIRTQMLDEKASRGELSGLTSTSATTLWRMWIDFSAFCALVLEQLFDIHAAEVEARAQRALPGTLSWYADQIIAWEPGRALEVTNGHLGYTVPNPSARLVRHVAITENQLALSIRVAADSAGTPVPLTAPQLAQLLAYIDRVKFAGTFTVVESNPPDVVKVNAAIYYDPVRDQAAVRTAVEAAVKAFLSGIDFGGRILLSNLVDAIQGVDGVVDVELQGFFGRPASSIYGPAAIRTYSPSAGYVALDTASGQTLLDTLAFIRA